MRISERTQERGGASIFVVIFSALLITVITVGFVQLMLRSQQDALTLDLSQSAYDSALAGVEDAKIAINIAENNDTAAATLADKQCGSVKQVLMDTNDGRETIIRQNVSDEVSETLAQAYTCVKVDMNPRDTSGTLEANQSDFIPLRTKDNAPFTHVTVTWRFKDNPAEVHILDPADSTLPHSADWPANRLALLRAQLIQYPSGAVRAGDFSDSSETHLNQAMFFLPHVVGSDGTNMPFSDATMNQIRCEDSGLSCSVTLRLPSGANQTRFIRLTSLYNSMLYTLSLRDGATGTPLPLEGVTAKVDSTGRAGDVYRRVEADVDLRRQSTYPEAALDVDQPICKDFTVGTKESHYSIRCDSPTPTP